MMSKRDLGRLELEHQKLIAEIELLKAKTDYYRRKK